MQSTKPAKRRFAMQQQQQQKLLDGFYAELDEGRFEQGTSGFEAKVEGNNDDDICPLLHDDRPDEKVPEEEEADVNKNVNSQENEVPADELPKKRDS